MLKNGQSIFIGTVEICRLIYDLSQAFESLGYSVDSGLIHHNPFNQHLEYTYNWQHYLQHTSLKAGDDGVLIFQSPQATSDFLSRYDIYIFQFANSLFPGNLDLPLLKQLNKKVVCIFNGDDIRHWSSADQFLQQFGINIPNYYKESSLPSHSSLQAYLSDNYCANRLSHKLHHLRMAEKYADVVLSYPDQSALAVRPYNQVKIPVNCSLYPHSIPNHNVPIVVHAPSFRSVKGTEEILKTLATLRAEGVQFELRLLEGMDNTQVIQNLIEADVLIDQLYLPGGGMLAREGMLTGCAVASPFLSELFPASPDAPLLSINQQNLYQKLKKLLTDRNLRLSLAFTGRAFVEKHNDHTQVAQQILLALGMQQPQINDKYDYYPTFFLEKYVLPDGEKIPEYLKVMTSQIIKKWGVPPNVNFENLVRKGLVAKEYLPPACLLHRWSSEKLVPGI